MNSDFENDMEKYDCESVGCPSIVPHEITVCVPITVKPFGETGNVKIKCEGEPVISSGGCCSGTPGGVCKFAVSQKLKVEIPVIFGARAEAGEASVDCGKDYCCDFVE